MLSWPVQSGSVALLKLGSVLMLVACVTTKGHVDARGLEYHLKPCYCPMTALNRSHPSLALGALAPLLRRKLTLPLAGIGRVMV